MIVPMEASSAPSAIAILFSVSSAVGAPSTRFAIACATSWGVALLSTNNARASKSV